MLPLLTLCIVAILAPLKCRSACEQMTLGVVE